jgi:hypothetical protein
MFRKRAMDIEAPEAQRGSGIISDSDRRQSEKRESVNYLTEDYSCKMIVIF